MFRLANRALDEDEDLEARIMHAISGEHTTVTNPESLGPTDEQLEAIRRRVGQTIGQTDLGEVDNGVCSTVLRGGLLSRWALSMLRG